MSQFEPMAFQATNIEKISKAITTLTRTDENKDRLIIFKAPTGAGKTLMVGTAIAAAYEKPSSEKFIVLWLSPSEGKLHVQTAKALTRILDGTSLQVHLLDTRDDIVRYQDPEPGSIFVANWDKLRAEKDGEFTNVMVREAETPSFFKLLANATAKGLDMLVVIDESHRNLGADKTEKLMTAIRSMRPFIQMEVSATPSAVPDPDLMAEGIHHWIRVRFEEVEAAGMIRKSALLNDRFSEVQARHPADPLSVQVLWAAWEKVEELRKGYELSGSPVKPLLLVQYPDGAEAVARAAVVEGFLADRGLSKGETYAVWLSGEHSDDLDKIASNESTYRALIFKQAIATGWDCPRAQVMVQFRDPKSPVFQIQTLGRLMRSPEQKHYENEDLNVAYVFSDLEGVSVRVETDESDTPLKDKQVVRGPLYPGSGLGLVSSFQPRAREFDYPMVEHLEPALKAALDEIVLPVLPEEPFVSTPVTIVTDARVTAQELDSGIERRLLGNEAEGYLDENLVQSLFDMLLVASIGQYRSKAQSLSRIKRTINVWFRRTRPNWEPDEIQHLALRHQTELISAIERACQESMQAELEAAIAAARSKRRTRDDWEIPVTDLVQSKEFENALPGLVTEPPLSWKSRSMPERRFETYLASMVAAGKISWWWKNGEGDEKYLGVEYSRNVQHGQDHLIESRITYPDYLVFTSTDVLWVIEVKDVNDPDGQPGGVTHSKAKGLKQWASKMGDLRNSSEELVTYPTVMAGVAVPIELAPGVISVKVANPDDWAAPNPANLANDAGWSDLDLV